MNERIRAKSQAGEHKREGNAEVTAQEAPQKALQKATHEAAGVMAEGKVHPRKLEIVQAAIACFLERGFHQTGVRDIAERAGISLGNLYNHFKSKDALLAYIAELDGAELAAFGRALSEGEDPRAALAGFMAEYGAYACRPENALLGVELLAEALRNPSVGTVFERHRRGLVGALAGCLEAGADSGVFARCDDMRGVASLMLDALEGYGLRRLQEGTADGPSFEALCAVLMRGVRA